MPLKSQAKPHNVLPLVLYCARAFVRIQPFHSGGLRLRRIVSIGQRLFMRLGLFVLALNVVLVSIPRCDMILAVLQHQGMQVAHAAMEAESCHDQSVPLDKHAKAWTSHRICECSVFQFMAFHAPELNLNEHVAFRVQSERLLTFPWKAFLSDFTPSLEPPYPKV